MTMRRDLQVRGGRLLAAILTSGIGLAATLLPAERAGLIASAQAQSDPDRRKKEEERRKSAPPRAPSHKAPSSDAPGHQTPSYKAPSHKVPAPTPKYQGAPVQKPLAPSEKPVLRKALPTTKEKSPHSLDGPGGKAVQPFQRKPAPDLQPDRRPDVRKESIKRPPSPPGSGQHDLPPKPGFKPPPSLVKPPSGGPVRVAPNDGPKARPPGTVLKRFQDVKKFRVERIEAGGKRKVIEEPGKRFIVKEHGRIVVRHDETERFQRRPGARVDRRPDGTVETIYIRKDGVRIVSVVDSHGRLLRRYRRDPDGRERNLIDSRGYYRRLGVGAGVLGIIALQLPPLQLTIPREKYIVDYEGASDDDLDEALEAPPIEDLDRAYSLEEIRDSYDLRARVRSIDIDTIHFDSGAWEVTPDQHGRLARIARAILRVLERNEEAVFMIAGHTDAVGSAEDNASLSDRRALAVAEVLTEQFDVPPENLVTQGYGEQHLKIDTEGSEPRNRRVSILNITALMAER
jgi:outer membrane protein OmpA-like peptidoglycan-associated protein